MTGAQSKWCIYSLKGLIFPVKESRCYNRLHLTRVYFAFNYSLTLFAVGAKKVTTGTVNKYVVIKNYKNYSGKITDKNIKT